jgi:peptidyl-prolyl cis-trans isomerase-like 4
MAVLLDTSAGELVIDLFVREAPKACRNFLSLCKLKYYNNCLIFNVQQNYILQSGDPTGTGTGGCSALGLLHKNENLTFDDEIHKARKFDRVGLVCMAHQRPNANRSQFFITLRDEDMDHLAEQYTVFGEISEGHDVLEILNNLYCDGDGRPYQDVRIKHTYVLDDPLEEIPGLVAPPSSPVATKPTQETVKSRIPYEENLDAVVEGRTEAEIEQSIKRKEAHSRAMVLEMVGDLPDAEAKPPVEVLFVCKLNSITTDADLEIIFSRFGHIRKCEIIRDSKTGDSLNYAFIEYDSEEACLRAYEKMNNVLIDDRRIKVDFSQSVAHLWNKYTQKPRQQPRAAPSSAQAGGNKPHGSPPAASPPNKHGKSIGDSRHQSAAGSSSGHGHKGRDGDDRRDNGGKTSGSGSRAPERDRSRDRRDSRDGDRDRDRDRERDRRERDRDGHRDRDRDSRRHQDTSKDHGSRRDDRSRDRSRDRHRERDRSGDRHRDRR